MVEHKLGSEFDKPDRTAFNQQFVKKFIDELHVSMTLRPPDAKQVADLIAKAKKIQFVATLSIPLLQVWLRGGSAKPILVGSKDLDSLRDNAKARGILEKLADSTKLITRDDVIGWQDTHMDDGQLAFFADTIARMEADQQTQQERYDELKDLKFTSALPDGLRAELHSFTAKHSWEHYLKFVEDIDAAKADATVYDTYVKPGATLPVNLGAALQSPIDKAIAAQGKVAWVPARTLIVKLIDSKFIPDMRKDEMAKLGKELKRLKADIPEKKKAFAKAGGKL